MIGEKSAGSPVTVTDTGGFRDFKEFSGNVELPAGLHVLRLFVREGGADFGDITFTQVTSPVP
jgi:hypothetical protein